MKAYLDLLRHVKETGEVRRDRTGVGTRGIFGAQLRFDLAQDAFTLHPKDELRLVVLLGQPLGLEHDAQQG